MSHKKPSAFSAFLKSFFYIILCACLFFSATNIYSILDMHKQLRASYKSMGNQVSLYLETNLHELNRLGELIKSNPKLMGYSLMGNLELPHNITSEINKLKSFRTVLSSVGLVYRNSVYDELNFSIFTNNSKYSINDYCTFVCSNGIDEKRLENIIKTIETPCFITNLNSPDKGGSNVQLIYAVPLPGDYVYSPGVLLFNLNYKELQNNIQNMVGSMSSIFIFDAENSLILYTESASNDINFVNLTEDKYLSDRQDDSIINKYDLRNYGITVYQAIDKISYYRPLYQTIFGFSIILIFMLAFGFALSYKFAKTHSRPIQNLLRKAVSTLGSAPAQEKSNEIELLDKMLDKLSQEKQQISRQMSSERLLVRNQLLLALINGKDHSDINSSYANEFLGRLDEADYNYCAIVFLIDVYADFIKDKPVKEQWIIKFSMCNIFEESCKRFGDGFAMDLAINKGIVGILKYNKNSELSDIALRICEELQAYMKRFDATLTCSIGTPGTDIYAISNSYANAVKNTEYRFFLSRNTVITPHLVRGLRMKHISTIAGLNIKLNQIIKSIKACETGDIERNVRILFQCVDSNKNIVSFKSTFFALLGTLNNFINESFTEKMEALNYKLDMLYESSYETIDEAQSSVCDFCFELSKEFSQLKENEANKDLYILINNFILDNYTNSNLSLTLIADKFSFNPSYLTRVFKDRNGMTLMQYIDRHRFEKAKELLLSSEYSIKEIVDMVGYVDEANFMRKFKKNEGVSPSLFRSMHKK